KFDVFDQNDLACIGRKHSIVDNLLEILPIALGQKLEGTRRTVGSPSQTFAIRIFADAFKQLPVSLRDPIKIFFRQPINITRKSLLDIEIGVTALNHKLPRATSLAVLSRANSADILDHRGRAILP